jgi:nucleoid DNA-binding protein
MNKEELVQEISKKANVTQKEATEVLSSLIDTIQKTVAKGKKVSTNKMFFIKKSVKIR